MKNLAIQVTSLNPYKVEYINNYTPNNKGILIEIWYSALNYKDALCITGSGKIARICPLIPGVEFVGKVIEDGDNFKKGDMVSACGWGIGENMQGAYAQRQRVEEKYLLPMFNHLEPRLLASVGTAGFTAMYAIEKLSLVMGDLSNKDIVVTGATGGS